MKKKHPLWGPVSICRKLVDIGSCLSIYENYTPASNQRKYELRRWSSCSQLDVAQMIILTHDEYLQLKSFFNNEM